MGWLALGGIAAVVFALLRRGVAGLPARFALAAMLLGAAGYAVQQHAALPGHPVRADASPPAVDPDAAAFRAAIMPGAPGDDLILATADNRVRDGDTAAAAEGLSQAIARHPGDAALWTGLGNALVAHDGGQVSPAARFAFRRAVQLDPRAPGPPFFLGLAALRAGDLAAARGAWTIALAVAPPQAPYRGVIAEQLATLDAFLAMQARRKPAP